MAKRDYDEVLGVARDADETTIKKAYRRLARENFEQVLSRMVPYHRETLLAALVRQREHRYEKPTHV